MQQYKVYFCLLAANLKEGFLLNIFIDTSTKRPANKFSLESIGVTAIYFKHWIICSHNGNFNSKCLQAKLE